MLVCLFLQAANTTEMWIITSGVDGGIAKIIGDAIREEKSRRASNRSQSHNVPVTDDTKLPKLTAIGVIPKSRVSYSQCLEEVVICQTPTHNIFAVSR